MSLSMYRLPSYPKVLERLKSGAVFLDLGCCFGQEIRDLVRAGVPSKNLYGSDLRQEFWDIGYELFRDKETLESTFYAADIFDESETSPLRQLDGKVDVIYAGSFFHLFSWDQQLRVAKRVVGMLKPVEGSILVGKQVGRKIGGVVPHRPRPGLTEPSAGTMWRHDGESWEKMWKETEEATGTEWDCKTTVEEFTARELEFLAKDGRVGSGLRDAGKTTRPFL
jgi:SAM-dependent methyltransferase